MPIQRMGPEDLGTVMAAAHLFDGAPQRVATERFLSQPANHLLLALDEDGAPVGFVSGHELTHPDKGTEMYLNELGVEESARGQGYGQALVEALAALARERGCFGMWGLTEEDNQAARRCYEGAGARPAERPVLEEWVFEPAPPPPT